MGMFTEVFLTAGPGCTDVPKVHAFAIDLPSLAPNSFPAWLLTLAVIYSNIKEKKMNEKLKTDPPPPLPSPPSSKAFQVNMTGIRVVRIYWTGGMY